MKQLSDSQAFVAERQTDYIRTFNTPHGEKVLADLAKFCRGNETTFHPDARVHAALEGRREAYLRIMAHLNLQDEALYRHFGAPSAPAQPQED